MGDSPIGGPSRPLRPAQSGMVTITGTEQKDRLLDGRYELLRQLGAGGMGRVYLAEDVVLHRRVAVKLLQPHCAADPAFEERLRREARAAAALTHPHVVPVHDLGENQGAPYIVMRYVPGETLKERVMRRGALPVEEAFRIADQTLRAVDHAHSNGVIHRDLTARNILLDERDDVQVTDFGIARLGSSPLTSAPAMLGTAHYAAPEQVRGIGGDARSDVYTVGIVLYEMLTGEQPFSGDDAMAVALQHVNEPPPAPSSRHPALGPELDALVLRALEKEPGRRYQSAAEFRRAIRAVAEGHAPAERPPVAADAAAADGHAAAPARAETARTRDRCAGGLPRRPAPVPAAVAPRDDRAGDVDRHRRRLRGRGALVLWAYCRGAAGRGHDAPTGRGSAPRERPGCGRPVRVRRRCR